MGITPAMKNLADLIEKGSHELFVAVYGLRNLKKTGTINEA